MQKENIESILKDYQCSYMGTDLVTANTVKDITVDGDNVSVKITLGWPAEGIMKAFHENLHNKIKEAYPKANITLDLNYEIIPHTVQKSVDRIKGIKNIIAIASGKGGVGKSTTAVNLALALKAEGASAAILDADIYGPSIPKMMGVGGRPDSVDGKSLEPKIGHGLQTMSIGLLVEEETPMIWRGPMVTQALEQLLTDTNWKDVDFLIIDLPPGTGDVQLTLCQKIPVSGAVIVTTPQDISLIDARKGLKMFEKVEVPVLGIVENMSTFVCPKCGTVESIFGQGGGEQLASENDVKLLGELPLEKRIREEMDKGTPTVSADPESQSSMAYREIARKMAATLSMRKKDYSSVFPKIVIQND
ncbi:MAG: iron-sulfur cluster carrier protein ApbC [Gammaproteobacteria bacterium]|nr:iron-sulfur cluster carrier protein ApbC [Gammaproteobacteria bacterium]|tara:strand:- start:10603 stop:11685 length:1083 start_codon:yes stop_codon:yes gene_type:complete